MEKDIKEKLDRLSEELKRRNQVAVAFDCEVICIYRRKDGFSKTDVKKYEYLTQEQFYYLTRRPITFLAMPKFTFSMKADEPVPAYVDDYRYEFYPKSFKWNKKQTKLTVIYEDRP